MAGTRVVVVHLARGVACSEGACKASARRARLPLKTEDATRGTRPLRRLLVLVAAAGALLPPRAGATPEFLACGSDASSRVVAGGAVMGQRLSRGTPGAPNILSYHPNIQTASRGGRPRALGDTYTPGENLTLELAGLDSGDFFVVRVSDGGGALAPAPAGTARAVTSKCAGQVFADEPGDGSVPARVTLETPCADAPAVITISAAGAADPVAPFWFADLAIARAPEGSVAARCLPSAAPAPPPYPFNLPLLADCPNGAAAQYGVPCPAVPCVYPPGKDGTCLTSSDGSTPATNASGGIDAEARVELLTDGVTPISHHFTTGSWPPPRAWAQDLAGWSLQVDGEVERPRNFTMAALRALGPAVTRRYVLECAGNWGRGLVPAAAQADWWNLGAVRRGWGVGTRRY
jgi:hypothetical protein